MRGCDARATSFRACVAVAALTMFVATTVGATCTDTKRGIYRSGQGTELTFVSVARVKVVGSSMTSRLFAKKSALMSAEANLVKAIPESWKGPDGMTVRGIVQLRSCTVGQWLIASAEISQESVNVADSILEALEDSFENQRTLVDEAPPKT